MLRFATSPTGDMHIEDLRVAILNYLVAQQKKEHFTVRIDDMDMAKNIEGKDTEIMQILEKFALTHASVFHQSEHLHMYQTLAIKLLEQGKAFVCTCSPEKLEADTYYSGHCFNVNKEEHAKLKESGTPFSIRIKKPTEDIVCHDLIMGDSITTPNDIDSFIILDTEGLPTHNFTCACDDMLSGVTTIIRKKEYLLDTPKQKHIKTALGYSDETMYAHLPVLLDNDDESSVKWLFEEGFVPDAIINYLILLGSSHAPMEIFTLPQAMDWFNIENISKTPVKFDSDTLRLINRKHLEMMDDKALSSLFGFADADIGKLAKIYLEEVSTIKALKSKIEPIFEPKDFKGEWGEQMKIMADLIKDAPMMNEFDTFKSYLMKESGLKDENFFNPLRYLLTGTRNGPELSEIYPFIKSYLLEVAS